MYCHVSLRHRRLAMQRSSCHVWFMSVTWVVRLVSTIIEDIRGRAHSIYCAKRDKRLQRRKIRLESDYFRLKYST